MPCEIQKRRGIDISLVNTKVNDPLSAKDRNGRNTRNPGLLKLFTTALNLMKLQPEVREIRLSYQHETKINFTIGRMEEI